MSNFVQNYEIKVDRQLFSFLVAVAASLIIFLIGKLFDAVKAHSATGKTAAVSKPASPKAVRPIVGTTAKPRNAAVPPVMQKPPTSQSQAVRKVPEVIPPQSSQRNMTLRQAVIWSEILKRKY